MKIKLIFVSIIFISLAACGQKNKQSVLPSNSPSDDFSQYWFQGKAELTSYNLEQARYGEMRKGSAVMIFVTEDFSNTKHVKLDDSYNSKQDAVKVLKLNHTRKFNTGVYPYSMMNSVFTPIDLNNFPRTIKTTTSSQEWCGHTFSQLNNVEGSYDFLLRSYFESEGDVNKRIEEAFLEDEIWNKIRINPEKLPQGEVDIIPSALYSRLSHVPLKVFKATAAIGTEEMDDKTVNTYELNYNGIERRLKVYFESKFPYSILKWEETYKSGFGKNAKLMTTTGIRNKSILLDYWSKNHNADSTYREALGLD